MSSIRWSELNDDSDQVSSASQDSQKIDSPKSPEISNLPHPHSLKKNISSPPQFQKNTDYQKKINEQLQKLKNHKQEKVWLYVLDSARNQASQVSNALDHNDDFEKVISMNKGWNVLLKTQKASQYLSKGIKKRGLNIKLIYSKMNEKNDQNDHKKGPRYDKHQPKRQFVSPNSRHKQIRSPKFKSKRAFSQKIQEPSNGDEKQKRKNKYVAKNTISHAKQQKVNGKNNHIIQEQINEEHNEQTDSPQKLQARQKKQQQKVELSLVKQPHHNLFKTNQNTNQEIKPQKEQKQQYDIEKNDEQKKQQKDEKKVEPQSDSSQELQRHKKMLEKKKTKKKKKGTKNGGNFHDSNNPFAALG